jgi:hypothetical protein
VYNAAFTAPEGREERGNRVDRRHRVARFEKPLRVGRGRGRAAALLALLLGGLAGCNNNDNGDTVNINGLDCGLIRDQLWGNWTVSYVAMQRNLLHCDNATFDGTVIDVGAGTANFATNTVTAAGGSTSFTAFADGPIGLSNELMANIEADSCLSLVQIWEDDDSGWLQCIGTADLSTRLFGVVCDSFDLDTDADGAADTACSLNGSISGTVGIP